MYRIIKLKKVSFSQANVVRISCVDVLSFRDCSLCNNPRSGLVRNHSTSMLHSIVRSSARKKKNTKSKNNVSELLSVEFFSASEEKARVTPLKVHDLTRFIKSPELSLQEMYKLRSKSLPPSDGSSTSQPTPTSQSLDQNQRNVGMTLVLPSKEEKRRFSGFKPLSFTSSPLILFDPLSSIPSSSDLKPSSITNSTFYEGKLSSVENDSKPIHLNSYVPSLKDFRTIAPNKMKYLFELEGLAEELQETEDEIRPIMKKPRKKRNSKEYSEWLQMFEKVKRERRDNNFFQNFQTFCQVCANSGQFKSCTTALLKYCKKLECQGKVPKVSLFEVVLNGAASCGSIDTVRSVLNIMHKFKVGLSLECYAACFECIGRLDVLGENVNMLSALLEDMKIQKYSFMDIFTQCKFYGDQKSMVLKAIQIKVPDFYIASEETDNSYEVNLLAALKDSADAKAERYISPASGLFSYASVCSWVDEQIHNDCVGVVKVPNIAFTLGESAMIKCLRRQARLEKSWAKMIREGFLRDLKMLRNTYSRKSNRLFVILKSLSPNEFVDLILQEVRLRFGDSEMFSPPLSYLNYNLGRKVKRLHDLKLLSCSKSVEITSNLYKEYCRWYLSPESYAPGPSNPREIWTQLESIGDNKQEMESLTWSYELQVEIGKFLYAIILRDIKIDVNLGRSSKEKQAVPAFYTIFRKHGHAQQEQLKMHPSVNRIYQPSGQPFITLESFDVPMCSPPVPWTNSKKGAFPIISPNLLRLPEGPGKKSRKEVLKEFDEIPPQQIYPALDALNQLGSIPWKVNIPVLDVVTAVFNSGGSEDLNIPLPPTAAYSQPSLPENATQEERTKFNADRMAIRKKQAESFSLWCDALYRLSLAHHFKDKVFWLPHNMDFRGRVYPIAPHLQHMGCDMARSLLVFAKGEELGPEGLDWLKIHTINLTGQKKREPISERLAYANKIMDKILDSADHPLTGDKWWTLSDEPWQTLAVCMEIATAIRSGDPENFISHFPVHQDGSCNGLQHYAALGRDAEGAASVNLAALDRPADVYSRVAEIVERRRKADAERGNSLAQALEGFVTRKVVKQTVMTTVYGVTRYGARLQIAGQLKDLEFPSEEQSAAAVYLASLTFDSIGEMFSSTQKIQNWLTDCANVIGKIAAQPVRWRTPLGLPVVQPYFKQVPYAHMRVQNPGFLQTDPAHCDEVPNVLKQRNGFPPNFIHSLDSCHMMLTSLFCEQSGIPFVSVHDCFWVHPCNVNKLNKICREQFVALHSEPILEDLSEYLIQTFVTDKKGSVTSILEDDLRHLKSVLCNIPPKGKFNLKEVLSSVYFFS